MKLSHRIWYHDHMESDKFENFCSYVRKNIDCIDELALFTEYSHHGYIPLEQIKANAAVIKEHIKTLKTIGVEQVGLNILCTIGHVDEAWDFMVEAPFQTVVGHDGQTSTANMCMRDGEWRKYIAEKYRLYASAEPDFIWLDDDLRVNNHTAQYPCFCDTCINAFNKIYSSQWTRETLVATLDSSDGGVWRQRWVEFNRDELRALIKYIGDTVRSVNKNIKLGLMTCSPEYASYGGSDIKEMLKALPADKFRPGGGFYGDVMLDEVVSKSYNVARQCEMSGHTTDIQYELEDFPFMNEKSLHSHAVEITAALMSGCDGIACNMDSAKDRDGLLDKMREYLPLWRHMTKYCDGFTQKGAYAAYNKEFIYKHMPNGTWFKGYSGELVLNEQALGLCGIPMSMNEKESAVTILSGEMVRPYTDEELTEILSGGVLMDGEALKIFEERGMADLCGCATDKAYFSGILEVYSDDELNGEMKGRERNTYMNFGNRRPTVYSLKKLNPDARELSRLQSVTGIDCGTGMVISENKLGGRVAVLPYEAWRYPDIRRRFIRRLCRWLSKDKMPLFIEEDVRVLPYIRQHGDTGKFMLMLLNASLDATGEFSVTLDESLSKATTINYISPDGTKIELTDKHMSDGRLTLKVKNITAWDFVVVEGC